MRVDAERRRGVAVPQLPRDVGDRGPVLQQQRRAGVAHLVEPAMMHLRRGLGRWRI